jgi:membrane protease subunit (stomatin/prohibitin family)
VAFLTTIKKMGLFSSKKDGGMMDMIRCDEQDYLIWKWRPAGNEINSTKKENAIRWGSSLRVKDGELAVFVYNQNDGTYQDYIEGPFDESIKTGNLPVLGGLTRMAYGGDTPFQAEVYFINLSRTIPFKARLQYFDVFDPRESLMDFPVRCAVPYQILTQISDYREFIKIHRLSNLTPLELEQKMRPVIERHIRALVINIPKETGVPVIQIETQLDAVNLLVESRVRPELERVFGIQINSLTIDKIDIDKDDDQFHKLKKLTADITERKTIVQSNIDIEALQAKSDVSIKNLKDQQRMSAEHSEDSMRIQREEAQRLQKLQTESNYFDTHKLNVESAKVGVQNVMSNTGVPGPPPLPGTSTFFVAVNGQQSGPFDLTQLQQLIANGQIQRDTFVWKQGMLNWEEAVNIVELKSFFGMVPPPPPPFVK